MARHGARGDDSPNGGSAARKGVSAVMHSLHVGDQVSYRSRTFVVRGLTPLSVKPQRVHLEDAETGERVDVLADDVKRRES